MRMKKFCAMLAIALMLSSCSTAPEPEVNPSSTASVESSEPSSASSSEPVSSVASSAPSSAVLSDSYVAPQYLLNVNTVNDLAFLIGMKLSVAEKFWDKNAVKIVEYEIQFPSKYEITLAPGVHLYINDTDCVDTVMIDYSKTKSRDAASLLGINGYDTHDSIIEKFKEQNIYPYKDNVKFGGNEKHEITKEMCAIELYGELFYRANFDENGTMTNAFIGDGI